MDYEYQMLHNLLNEMLRVHNISTHCDVFEETLLFKVGIKNQLTQCQFGGSSNNKTHFKIIGISSSEAKLFSDFLYSLDPNSSSDRDETPFTNHFNFYINTKILRLWTEEFFEDSFNNHMLERPQKISEYQSVCAEIVEKKPMHKAIENSLKADEAEAKSLTTKDVFFKHFSSKLAVQKEDNYSFSKL